MKKICCAVIAVLFAGLLAGCSDTAVPASSPPPPSEAETVTIADLQAANQLPILLEEHPVIIYSQLNLLSGDICYRNYFRSETGEYTVSEIWNSAELYGEDRSYLLATPKRVSFYGNVYPETSFSYAELAFYEPLPEEITSKQELLSKDADGNWVISQSRDCDQETIEALSGILTLTEQDYFTTIYTFDAKTLRIQRIDYQVDYSDDRLDGIIFSAVIRVGEAPQHGLRMQELLAEETHQLTVHREDGREFSFAVPASAVVEFQAEEDGSFFMDAEYTVPYTLTEPLTEDMTLYAKLSPPEAPAVESSAA